MMIGEMSPPEEKLVYLAASIRRALWQLEDAKDYKNEAIETLRHALEQTGMTGYLPRT
jgi:hypothetical protein